MSLQGAQLLRRIPWMSLALLGTETQFFSSTHRMDLVDNYALDSMQHEWPRAKWYRWRRATLVKLLLRSLDLQGRPDALLWSRHPERLPHYRISLWCHSRRATPAKDPVEVSGSFRFRDSIFFPSTHRMDFVDNYALDSFQHGCPRAKWYRWRRATLVKLPMRSLDLQGRPDAPFDPVILSVCRITEFHCDVTPGVQLLRRIPWKSLALLGSGTQFFFEYASSVTFRNKGVYAWIWVTWLKHHPFSESYKKNIFP
jgi:hypothetical protein